MRTFQVVYVPRTGEQNEWQERLLGEEHQCPGMTAMRVAVSFGWRICFASSLKGNDRSRNDGAGISDAVTDRVQDGSVSMLKQGILIQKSSLRDEHTNMRTRPDWLCI
jgi:hypothetical protein